MWYGNDILLRYHTYLDLIFEDQEYFKRQEKAKAKTPSSHRAGKSSVGSWLEQAPASCLFFYFSILYSELCIILRSMIYYDVLFYFIFYIILLYFFFFHV